VIVTLIKKIEEWKVKQFINEMRDMIMK